jgi:hypothetical protein
MIKEEKTSTSDSQFSGPIVTIVIGNLSSGIRIE